MSFIHKLYRSDPDYAGCGVQPPWTGVEEWARVTCPDCLSRAPLRIRTQLGKTDGAPRQGMSVTEILAMDRRNRVQQASVATLTRELHEAHLELDRLREKLRGVNLIRLTAARFGVKQEDLVAAFLDWISAGNPLTRRPFVPKEDPMILDALRTLAQLGVLSHPDRFPRVAVLSAPPVGGDFQAYRKAIHTLDVLAVQGGASAIRFDVDDPEHWFQLWPNDAEHEKALREAITPTFPPRRDRHGVPILRGSMIRIAPRPGSDRSFLAQPFGRGCSVPGTAPLYVLEADLNRPDRVVTVLVRSSPAGEYYLEPEDLLRTEVVGSGMGVLPSTPPADPAPWGS